MKENRNPYTFEDFLCSTNDFLPSTVMAEILGIVASGVALVEVAAKIGSQVLTLKQLWEEIKDAPHTIRSLIDDIYLLHPVLREIETYFGSPNSDPMGQNNDTGKQVMKCCRSALDELISSKNELSFELNHAKHFKRGVIKATLALKRDVWVQHEKRLQRVVWMLGLVQQYYLL